MPSARLDRILADDYVAGLADLPLDEVRARRSESQEVEVGLSYARRIVQGRLDIIHAELERRAAGERSDASSLVDRLKEGAILSEHQRPAGFGRLPTVIDPGEVATDFLAEADAIAHADAVGNLPDLSDDEVRDLVERLGQLERSLSDRRRQVFDRIDALQAEIVRRYKAGAVTPESLLEEG